MVSLSFFIYLILFWKYTVFKLHLFIFLFNLRKLKFFVRDFCDLKPNMQHCHKQDNFKAGNQQ